MSIGGRMAYADAYKLAEVVSKLLGPTVELLKCVGSLRRGRRTIGDIEFLARPHSSPDLFGGPATVHLDKVREVMEELGTWVKGGSRQMQITDLHGRGGGVLRAGRSRVSAARPTGGASEGAVGRVREPDPMSDRIEVHNGPDGYSEPTCGRCGSGTMWLECDRCDDGFTGHDCGEDCCACLYPVDNVLCDVCLGRTGRVVCISSREWCEAHPLPGRQEVKSTAMSAEAWGDYHS